MSKESSERIDALSQAFLALYKLVVYLRGEHGCPWDREQSIESMHRCLQEETEELGEAIREKHIEGVNEEWGDVFFIALMMAVIGEDEGSFDTERALRSVEAKMMRRHPHVFGSSDVNAVEDILAQWQRVKAKEKSDSSKSLMDDIPSFYSALKRAGYVQKKAAEVGFDWPKSSEILEKIREETNELHDAIADGEPDEIAAEIGDLLFSCVNLARFSDLDSEALLSKTIDKFVERFKYVESELERSGKSPSDATLSEMDALWEKSKARE